MDVKTGLTDKAERLLAAHCLNREQKGAGAADSACVASLAGATAYLIRFHGHRKAFEILSAFADSCLLPELPA